MNYVFLRRGDILPAVGVLQKLLNRGGSKLKPDGNFGPKTKLAVEQFQRQHRPLVVDGIVGEFTWPRVSTGANLPIIDCVDVCDLASAPERDDIRRVGGNPLLIGCMSNGVEEAVREICAAASRRDIFMLRFHGHGSSGDAGISNGEGVEGEHLTAIHRSNWARIRPIIGRLRFLFGPYGCVQFMHCSTGRGPKGRYLLKLIADELDVPVTAAMVDQWAGGGQYTFHFEGPTFTAVPRGLTLQQWCASLPDFAGMTVA